MTDEQLIQLVESKTPEELSLEEIESLRAGLADSPELQRVLAQQLSMEQYLSDALGRVNVSLEDIFAQAQALQPSARQRMAKFGWPVAAVVMLVLGGGFYWVSQNLPELTDGLFEVAAVEEEPVPVESAPPPLSDAKTKPSKESNTAETDPDPAEAEPSAEEVLDQTGSQQATQETTEPDPVEAPAPPPAPWEADDQLGGPVLSLEEAGFPELEPKEPLTIESLQRWFTGIASSRPKMQPQKQGAVLQGLFKLQAPWPEGAVLRLNVASSQKLRIHFWHGQQGVTLRLNQPKPEQNWSAYATTRDSGEPRPASAALSATDYGRSWRTGASAFQPVDIRFQNGQLILARGSLRLLSAPMASAPEEVVFENAGHLRQIRMFRCESLPKPGQLPRTVTLDSQPANLQWTTSLPEGAAFEKLEDGTVRLSASKEVRQAWAATALPPRGLQEVLLEIDNYQPGVAVYLGDTSDKLTTGARVVEDANSGQMMLTMLPFYNRSMKSDGRASGGSKALIQEKAWVRLLSSFGKLKCWVSTDGKHWAQVETPSKGLSQVTHVGLACAYVGIDRGITLRQLQVRSLDGLNRLVDQDLLAQAKAVEAEDIHAWLAKVDASRPEQLDVESWRRASAIRSLASGMNFSLASPLTRRLLQSSWNEPWTTEQRLEFLGDLALAVDLTTYTSSADLLADLLGYYDRAGLDLMMQGNTQPFSQVGRLALASPFWTTRQVKFTSTTLPRAELIAQAASRNWDAVLKLTEELRATGFTKSLPLLDGIESLAFRQLPNRRPADFTPLDADTLHPLVTQISREGFNVLAELEVALASESYKDACRIVTSSQAPNSFGLLPHATDEDLWVSLPLTVADAMRQHPMLLETMLDEYGPLGRLRIRQAIDQGNASAVQDVTIQFFGTPAAALAHLWLGDRHLSSGDFSQARRHYRQASESADPSLQLQIAARERFTAAMMGHDTGEPIEDDVKIGDAELTAEQFESLIADLLKDRRKESGRTITVGDSSKPAAWVPRPCSMKVDSKVSFKAHLIRSSRPLIQHGLDWAARQFGAATDKDTLYVNNGARLVAQNHHADKILWQANLVSRGGENLSWPQLRMRPVLAGEHILARSLIPSGIRLSCVSSQSGKVQWQSQNSDEESVISDPLVFGSEVTALTGRTLGRQVTVLLTTWDLATGEVRRSRPILQLEQSWMQYASSSLTTTGDSLIAILGGSVVCCDMQGQVRWLRRQFWLAPELAPGSITQHACEPLVLGDRIYVTQPGVQTLDCIEISSGRRLWSQVLPDVRRALGHFEKNVIVEIERGFLSLHADTGRLQWRHDVARLLDARLCGTPGGLLYARAVAGERRNFKKPQLVWVDPSTGLAQGSFTIDELASPDPQLGSMFTVGENLFVLAGFRQQDTSRRLFRLSPSGKADPPPSDLDYGKHW